MDRLSDGSRCFLRLFTVRLGGGRVGLGLFMLPLLVMMSGFHVVMGRHLMVGSRRKVMLDCFGLRLGCHLGSLSENLADRAATLRHGGQLSGGN